MKNTIKLLAQGIVTAARLVFIVLILSPVAFIMNMCRGMSLKEHFENLSFCISMVLSNEEEPD